MNHPREESGCIMAVDKPMAGMLRGDPPVKLTRNVHSCQHAGHE